MEKPSRALTRNWRTPAPRRGWQGDCRIRPHRPRPASGSTGPRLPARAVSYRPGVGPGASGLHQGEMIAVTSCIVVVFSNPVPPFVQAPRLFSNFPSLCTSKMQRTSKPAAAVQVHANPAWPGPKAGPQGQNQRSILRGNKHPFGLYNCSFQPAHTSPPAYPPCLMLIPTWPVTPSTPILTRLATPTPPGPTLPPIPAKEAAAPHSPPLPRIPPPPLPQKSPAARQPLARRAAGGLQLDDAEAADAWVRVHIFPNPSPLSSRVGRGGRSGRGALKSSAPGWGAAQLSGATRAGVYRSFNSSDC